MRGMIIWDITFGVVMHENEIGQIVKALKLINVLGDINEDMFVL